MLDLTEMAEELQNEVEWQSTPLPVYKEDFIKFIAQAIKKFFVDVNHPDRYDRTLYTTTEDEHTVFDYDFDLNAEEYIYILAKLKFKNKVYSDVSGDGAISYTTNALSVTGAKEGYKSIQADIDALERERIRVFHKIMAHEET